MNDVQTRIAQLQEKGWTLAALADELGVTPDAVQKWKAKQRQPHSQKSILIRLDQLTKKRPPKQRRYAKNSRSRKPSDSLEAQV